MSHGAQDASIICHLDAFTWHGFFPVEDLKRWGELDCHLQGHPDRLKTSGVEMTSCILGHGIAIGAVLALVARLDGKSWRVYVLLGDGECRAGVVWEGAMTAAKYRLSNMTAIVDYNDVQLDGPVHQVMPMEPMVEKWRACNWAVLEINGHNMRQVLEALDTAQEIHDRPTLILAHTTKGKGVSYMENQVVENRRLYRDLEGIYADTVRALGAAIDAKDPYTRGHSVRVARIAVAVASALGLPEEEVSALRIASHLHDVGKIAVDTGILQKAGRLSDQEMTQIHRHPTVSYDILSNIAFPYPDVALIACHHHERFDGGGYPDRLGSEALKPGFRIISIADSFDAMTSDRPYRPALELEEAIRRLSEGVGVQFDPFATRAFLSLLRDEVRGDAPEPAIVPGLTRNFSAGEVIERIDGIVRELDSALVAP